VEEDGLRSLLRDMRGEETEDPVSIDSMSSGQQHLALYAGERSPRVMGCKLRSEGLSESRRNVPVSSKEQKDTSDDAEDGRGLIIGTNLRREE